MTTFRANGQKSALARAILEVILGELTPLSSGTILCRILSYVEIGHVGSGTAIVQTLGVGFQLYENLPPRFVQLFSTRNVRGFCRRNTSSFFPKTDCWGVSCSSAQARHFYGLIPLFCFCAALRLFVRDIMPRNAFVTISSSSHHPLFLWVLPRT